MGGWKTGGSKGQLGIYNETLSQKKKKKAAMSSSPRYLVYLTEHCYRINLFTQQLPVAQA
jgi:hypothetical protein